MSDYPLTGEEMDLTINALRADLDKLRETIAERDNSIVDLEADLKNGRINATDLETEITDLKASVEDLESDLEAERKSRGSLQEQLDAFAEENGRLREFRDDVELASARSRK